MDTEEKEGGGGPGGGGGGLVQGVCLLLFGKSDGENS